MLSNVVFLVNFCSQIIWRDPMSWLLKKRPLHLISIMINFFIKVYTDLNTSIIGIIRVNCVQQCLVEIIVFSIDVSIPSMALLFYVQYIHSWLYSCFLIFSPRFHFNRCVASWNGFLWQYVEKKLLKFGKISFDRVLNGYLSMDLPSVDVSFVLFLVFIVEKKSLPIARIVLFLEKK
jgi:hypothetical protein